MNPYDPQRPSSAEAFAGREKLVARVGDFIELAKAHRRSGALLVHGHRGSGKTSALRKIQALVGSTVPDSVTIEIPLRARSSESALLRDIVEEARRVVVEERPSWKRVLEGLKAIDVKILGTGVGVAGRDRPEESNPLSLWRQCLSALAQTALFCVCVDDAEQLDKAGLGSLKTIAESASRVPILLAVAGGPELMKMLSAADASPVARAFSGATFDLEAFSRAETEAALDAPIRAAGVPGSWTPDAVDRLYELSHGYPYLAKCLAYAAYRDTPPVNARAVDAAVQVALDVASSWLEREISHASDVDVITFAKIAGTGRPSLSSAQILELGVQSPYIGRLVKLGVLEKVARGRYELRKAPVIAYYHLLRRQLSHRLKGLAR
jgi:type II secretory pathway predicted ATPase ExeA